MAIRPLEVFRAMSWQREVDEINQRRKWAHEMGGTERISRQRERGYLNVRERITGLVDPGSFREVGKLAGSGSYKDGKVVDVKPAPYVMGLADIDGRPVAVGGEDTTVGGGTFQGGMRRKGGQGGFVDDLALEYRIPLIRLIDGFGGSAGTAKLKGYSVLPGHSQNPKQIFVELLGQVPVVGAVLGVAAGGPAARAVMSHFSVMVKKQSQIFASGPAVVERGLSETATKEELGGYKVAVERAGTVHNAVDSEEEAFETIRRFLSYMPPNVWKLPPRTTCDDPVDRCENSLLDIVPRDRRQPYDMRKLIAMVVDRDSMFEIQPSYGRAAITVLARMNGRVIGIIANNPMLGGAVDARAARKQTHFVDLCDTFHIPIIFFADVPGFAIGTVAESEAVLVEGMRLQYAQMQATVPITSVIVRRCFGMAGAAMTDYNGLDFKIAWPSAEWGSLPVEGGVAAAFRREIANSPDPVKRTRELEDEMREYSSPFLTAEAFGVEDIIDPRETRPYLCQFIDAMQGRLEQGLGPKMKSGVRP
jgi:acetyl-CoA carboxylase carboxyltransferase component